MVLESVKALAVEWLDWAARYAAKEPKEFFTRRTIIHVTLFRVLVHV